MKMAGGLCDGINSIDVEAVVIGIDKYVKS